MRFSDYSLNLKPLWFTGKEWANGTAHIELRRQYFQAIDELKTSGHRGHKKRYKDVFQYWFADSLRKDDSQI